MSPWVLRLASYAPGFGVIAGLFNRPDYASRQYMRASARVSTRSGGQTGRLGGPSGQGLPDPFQAGIALQPAPVGERYLRCLLTHYDDQRVRLLGEPDGGPVPGPERPVAHRELREGQDHPGRDDKKWRKHSLATFKGQKATLTYRAVHLDPLTKAKDGGIDLKKIAPKARVY